MRSLLFLVTVLALVAGAARGSSPSSPLPTPSPSTVLCEPAISVDGPGVPGEVTAAFAAQARGLVTELRPLLGDDDCRPIVITLVPSMSAAPGLDPPWRLPGWAAGAARPDERRIVVGITSEGRVQDRSRTLRHELVHVLARSASGGRDLPRWLDEGIARVVAGEHGIEDMRVLAQARIGDRFLPLVALEEGFPASSADAALAYAQSGRVVSLLADRDDDAIARLLRGFRGGATVDDALRQVSGRATWQLDLDMRRSIGLWGALATVGLETDLAMASCGVVVAVFGVRARRRQRARLAAMVDEDDLRPPSATATVARWTVPRAAC